MATILSLQPKAKTSEAIQQDIILCLEEALELAKLGEISSVVVILNRVDGWWHEKRSDTTETTRDIGRLEILKQKWIAEYLKATE